MVVNNINTKVEMLVGEVKKKGDVGEGRGRLEMLKGDEKEYMVKKGEGGCRLGEQ